MMLHAINCDLGHRQYQAVKCMPADINEADRQNTNFLVAHLAIQN